VVAWVVWELWRVFWLQDFTIGFAGWFVLPWSGWGIAAETNSAPYSEILLPAVLGAIAVACSGLLAWRKRGSVGMGLLGLGAILALGWAVFAALVGVGSALDARLQLPVFATGFSSVYDSSPWGRWVFDLAALLCVAVLLGFGPRTALALRALWTGILIVVADSFWRVGVALVSGQIPLIYRGFGNGDWVFEGGFGYSTSLPLLCVFAVFGVLAWFFVALFANLPTAEGPHRSLVVLGLAGAGLWLGFQGAALYSVGLLEALGSEPVLLWPMPEYPGMLAFLRLAFLGTGALILGLAAWRAGE